MVTNVLYELAASTLMGIFQMQMEAAYYSETFEATRLHGVTSQNTQ
jgi:hypothetical protein